LAFLLVSGLLYCQPSTNRPINYLKADSTAKIYTGRHIKNLPVLVYNLTSNLDTEIEKFRAIYTWVCTHVKNDYASYIKTISKRKKLIDKEEKLKAWNRKYLPKVYKKLLNKQETSCTGYAYLIKQMATLADLECEIVNGFARTANVELNKYSLPNHSWNVVKLNNKWHLCDATWSAGRVLIENDIPKFTFDFSDVYFLASPELFSKNHYPTDKKWLLLDTPYSYEEFRKGPLVYKSTFKYKLIPKKPNQMFLKTKKDTPLMFDLFAMETFKDEILTLIEVKGQTKTIYNPPISGMDEGFRISHTFKKNGVYDVHLAVNDNIVATYVVTVSKNSSYP